MKGSDFKLRTEFEVGKAPFPISLKDKILLAGSCFSDVVGEQLKQRKFDVLINPFGNIYNPYSLFKLLKNTLDGRREEDYSFLENNGRYLNYDYHSEICAESEELLIVKINEIKSIVQQFLRQATVLILTIGTSFVYRLTDNDEIVANCHKIPAKYFKKHLLSPKDLIDDFGKLHQKILEVNPGLKIIFTVSPVRHIKDTIPLNSLSKSILRTGIHYICEEFEDTSYFPSFEIMMDDLRDYRFYKEDLIHPTEFAEKYIWKKFSDTYFDNNTSAFIQEFEKVKTALTHKPFNPKSKEHQRFLTETLVRVEDLNKLADMTEELNLIRNQLKS